MHCQLLVSNRNSPKASWGKWKKKCSQQEGVEVGNFWVNELSRVGGKGGLRAIVTPV